MSFPSVLINHHVAVFFFFSTNAQSGNNGGGSTLGFGLEFIGLGTFTFVMGWIMVMIV